MQGYNFFDRKSGEVIKASKVRGSGLKRLIKKGIKISHKTTQIYDNFKYKAKSEKPKNTTLNSLEIEQEEEKQDVKKQFKLKR